MPDFAPSTDMLVGCGFTAASALIAVLCFLFHRHIEAREPRPSMSLLYGWLYTALTVVAAVATLTLPPYRS